MTYGKEYKQLINFQEFQQEELFEKDIIDLCKKYNAILFINGVEQKLKKLF